MIDKNGYIIYRGFTSDYAHFQETIINKQLFESYDDIVTFNWKAYPQYPSKAIFPPIILDDGVYYISALESATSAQEIMAVAGRNVANLVIDSVAARFDL